MNITILGFVFGLLLLALPIYIIYNFKLNVMRRLLVFFGRMFIGVILMSVIVFGALQLKSIVFDIILFLLLSLTSATISLSKARLSVRKLLLPISLGSIVAAAIVGFYFIFLVLGEKNPFTPHIFIPLFGIFTFGIIGENSKALQTYYTGLLHHGQLYYYILGNGGTHREAISYFVRRGLQASIIVSCKQMSKVMVTTAPVILLSMIMCGCNIITAAAFQILFYIAILTISIISLLIALLIGKKYSFDEYERLKPVFKEKIKLSTNSDASVSSFSSNLSELQHTDSENPQQEV